MPATKKKPSARKTSITRKRTNLGLEQKAKKFRQMYEEMTKELKMPCEVAFNIILLILHRRDAYLFERFNKSATTSDLLNNIIGYIERMKSPSGKSMFQILYLANRFGKNLTKITKEEFMLNHNKFDLIIYRTGDAPTKQILEKDTYGFEFGKLLKLVCATDLRDFYAHKMYQRGQPYGGQIRYYIDCEGEKSIFMMQMCPAVTSPQTQKLLADDISQYQAIGRGLGITIGWYSPKMGKLTHCFFKLGIKLWQFFK